MLGPYAPALVKLPTSSLLNPHKIYVTSGYGYLEFSIIAHKLQ